MDNKQNEKLKSRIVFNKDIFGTLENYDKAINDLLEDSKFIALSTLYPFEDYSSMDLPSKYNNWQLRCCIELYNMSDKSIYVSYSENGFSFSKLTDGLSISLMNELTPKVGVPKSVVKDDSNV